jgi:hypothetical protein
MSKRLDGGDTKMTRKDVAVDPHNRTAFYYERASIASRTPNLLHPAQNTWSPLDAALYPIPSSPHPPPLLTRLQLDTKLPLL